MSQEGKPLTCAEVIEFLWAYISHELPPERAATFEEHLALCPGCIVYLDTYRRTLELTQGALSEPEADEIPAALVQAILAARKREE